MARFVESDGIIREKSGHHGAVVVTPRNRELNEGFQKNLNLKESESIILD